MSLYSNRYRSFIEAVQTFRKLVVGVPDVQQTLVLKSSTADPSKVYARFMRRHLDGTIATIVIRMGRHVGSAPVEVYVNYLLMHGDIRQLLMHAYTYLRIPIDPRIALDKNPDTE